MDGSIFVSRGYGDYQDGGGTHEGGVTDEIVRDGPRNDGGDKLPRHRGNVNLYARATRSISVSFLFVRRIGQSGQWAARLSCA